MIKEIQLKKYLEDLEKFMLGDLQKGKLQIQLISCINCDEDTGRKIRRLLKWILTDKYVENKR